MPSKPVLLIDTREQRPWSFPGWRTRVKTLKHGDYSVAGHESRIAIERKSVPDLFHSFTKTRDRMEKRLRAMGKLECSALVVEGSAGVIIRGTGYSNVNGRLLLGTVAALCASNGVSLILAADRDDAERVARHLLEGFIRQRKARKGNDDSSLRRRKKRALHQ